MKNNPLMLVLWIMIPFLAWSTQGWSSNNETFNKFSEKDITCSMSISATAVGVYCGESTGAIDVKITGGKAPYKIEWDNNDSSIWAEISTNSRSYRIPNLPRGMYLVKVTDAEGCREMISVMMDDNASDLTYVIEPGDPCSTKGSLTIRVSGASAPYWVILEGPTSGAVLANSNNFRIDDLLPGNYKVVVDKDGCGHAQNTIIKTSPSPLTLTITPQGGGSCGGGGDVMLNLSGGNPEYLISWYGASNGSTRSNGSKLVQNLSSGDYTFTVRDANDCTTSASISVTNSGSDLSVSLTQTPDPCSNGGQIGVSINGGQPSYRVDYSGPVSGSIVATNTAGRSGTAAIPNLPAGSYNITVIDSKGCTSSSSISVTGGVSDLACVVTQTPVLCDNMGQIGVAISGGQPSYRVDYSGPVSGSVIATNTAAQAGNASILNLPAGTYTIVVIDSRGCTASEPITVGSTITDLKCIVTQTPVLCDNMGQIGVAISGGQPTYRVDYSGPVSGAVIATSTAAQAGTASILNLPSGEYTVKVTDSRGCSATEKITVGGTISDLKCIVTQTPGVCDHIGQIGVSINGGQPTYRVDYTGPVNGAVIATTTAAQAGTAVITGVPAGTYTVKVTDSRGCSATQVVTVSSGASDLACIVTQTPVICDNMGHIGVAISGGQPTYRVDYSGPISGAVIATTTGDRAATASILDLPAGTYTVKVTDSRGCSASESITVGGSISDLACIVTQTPVLCDNLGQIGVSISGGQPTYRVDYSGPISGGVIATTTGDRAATASILDLPAGTYTITVIDSRGCSASESITVGGSITDLTCVVSQTPVVCNNMGQIGVAIKGGQPTYRVDYTGPVNGGVIATTTAAKAGTATIPNLPAGTYIIQVTDSRGCTAREIITVDGIPNDLASHVSVNPQICSSGSGIVVDFSGGTPTYTVSYSGPVSGSTTSTGGSITIPLPLGDYTIVVTDANGCSTTEKTTVGTGVNDLHCMLIKTHAICIKNGFIEVVISGGKPGFTVHWKTGHIEGTGSTMDYNFKFEAPCPGPYDITVTDANGCTVMESTTILQLENNLVYQLIANPGIQEGNGNIGVYFQSGKAPYTIDVTGPVNETTISHGAVVLSNLPSGVYSINITDANGCQNQQYVTVPSLTAPPTPTPTPDGMRVTNGDTGISEVGTFFSQSRTESDEFEVYQNYPNPFTTATTIGFNLPKAMEVSILVQDHLGKTIAVVSKAYAKGYNEYELNRNTLSSGVFYYTVKAGNNIKTIRMLNVK